MEAQDLKVLTDDFLGLKSREKELKWRQELASIDSISALIFYWGYPLSRSKRKREIEIKMARLLWRTHCVQELLYYWKETEPHSKPQKLIEIRVLALLKGVSRKNIPDWFVSFLETKEEIPLFLKRPFLKKVVKIRKSIVCR